MAETVAATTAALKKTPEENVQAQFFAPKKEQKKTVVPFKPDSVGYTIVGTETTYTIKEGETLTRVALRFYRTKALWPYIVKHNPDVIKNPDKCALWYHYQDTETGQEAVKNCCFFFC